MLSVFLVLLIEREKFYWQQRTQSDHLTWSHLTLLPLRPMVDNKKTKKTRIKCDLREVRSRWNLNELQSWTKVLGHFCISGRFPIHTGPTSLSLTPQSRIFSLYRVGEGKLQENFEKDALFYEGPGMTEKIWILHYCPEDFCPWL